MVLSSCEKPFSAKNDADTRIEILDPIRLKKVGEMIELDEDAPSTVVELPISDIIPGEVIDHLDDNLPDGLAPALRFIVRIITLIRFERGGRRGDDLR
jgi:hypothetical protein